MSLGCRSRLDGKEAPLFFDSFESMVSPIDESEAAPCNQIAHGPRNQNLVRRGLVHHASSDMHGDPRDVQSPQLTLPRMDPQTNF